MKASEACKSILLFQGLKEEDLVPYEEDLKKRKFKVGDLIITEHDNANSLFYIMQGKVTIKKSLKSMESPFAELTTLQEGEVFGEMGIISDAPRSATVEVLEDVEVLDINKEAFVRLSYKHPVVMINLMQTLSTRLRDTNERFVELLDEMLRKNRLMTIGMAVSRVIHDIKTPLTVIILTAQLIENLYPDSDKFSQSIVKQSRLIDQMVREILDFARGVEVTPVIQKVDLNSFFEELQKCHETAMKGRDIDLVFEHKITEPVYFDENKIRRVMENLIKNASEAMIEPGEIRVTATKSSGWLQISVIDNGPGVPMSIRDSIFQPFVTEEKQRGTGLGLPICHKIVMEHKGRMEYFPVEPHGSRFDVRLPQTVK
ncbi:MAG: cyclic nucleotide-binding domain-containing protein [Candidatus Cloacimonetes bacterium]|jgi:signal transduction histidine kinase|nr:cyclic nucleotide-binding domain-containing protein [Candidatus Cloacimonadota bacterium]NLO44048.1 cyclic nucleotide-binding domain-containing protein [Candidatus Cloacimonadota bacterium]